MKIPTEMRHHGTSVQGAADAAARPWRMFIPQKGGDLAERKRFALLILLCFCLHVAALAFLLLSRAFDLPPPPPEESAVEVIVEPPPAQEPPPQPRQETAKPPPPPRIQAPEMQVKEATDAPRAANKETVERDAPDKETKAPSVAPPKEEMAPKPETKQAPEDARDDAAKTDREKGAPKSLEDKLDAETIERAEPSPTPNDKAGQKQAKPDPHKGEARSIADQVAALAALPDFELAAAAKPSPVGGGTAKTTYLSILYGLIMPRMQIPDRIKTIGGGGKGMVAFYIDSEGHLTHQAVAKSSGIAELDSAALAAVKRAAPFPPPPPGHPHALLFTYSPK